MTKKYRTRFEIVNDFLSNLEKRKNSGLSKTKLQQESNLSQNGFMAYFNELII